MHIVKERQSFCPACRRHVRLRPSGAGTRPGRAARTSVRVVVYRCTRCEGMVEADTVETIVA